MKSQLSLSILAGIVLLVQAVPAQAIDLKTVWDTKYRCFRPVSGGDCGTSYNVTTRTYATSGQKTGAVPAAAAASATQPAVMPSQALRALGEPAAEEAGIQPVAAEAAAKQEGTAEKAAEAKPSQAKPAETKPAAAKPAGQEAWDVSSPSKIEAKRSEKGADSQERRRGIRKNSNS